MWPRERREQVGGALTCSGCGGTADGQCDPPMLFTSPELRTSGLWRLSWATVVLFIFYSSVVCSESSSPLGPFTQAVLSGGRPGLMASGRGRGRDFGALVTTHGIISSHFL